MLYPHQRQVVEVAVREIHNRFKTGVGEAPNRRSVLAWRLDPDAWGNPRGEAGK